MRFGILCSLQDDTMPVAPEVVLEQLRWRYAVKQFDSTRTIPDETWRVLEESLVLAPSSFGLQPWKFFVITDRGLREKLQPLTWNQSQVTQASHLVVFGTRTPFGLADIERHMTRISAVTGSSMEQLAGYQRAVSGFLDQPNFDSQDWAALQVYLALGVFLTTAAMLGVDACPMEGFQPLAYDETLGLPALGYRSVVLVAAGYRSSTDRYAQRPKVRFAHEDVIGTLPS